ncbi:MAG: hypothetical protein SPJ13_00250, partial [Bacteroidales bacterium]|nr:hypothetical protein [Bacteroidales bacterium]
MVAAIAGICVITSCSKEESKSKDVMRNKILSSNDLCDSISNEIAKHHNIYLEDFIAKNLDNLSALNQNLADFLYND